MDTKDTKEIRERHEIANEEAQRLQTKGNVRHKRNVRKINGLWIWLGVLILIFILLWWLYTIGTFEALSGVING